MVHDFYYLVENEDVRDYDDDCWSEESKRKVHPPRPFVFLTSISKITFVGFDVVAKTSINLKQKPTKC